jgi:cell division septal protein FtsQ
MAETKDKKNRQKSKKTTSDKSTKQPSLFKKRWVRILLATLLVGIVITATGLLIKAATNAFFFENSHFTLRHIVVKSPGWWNGRSEKVASILGLTINKDNLFSIDLAKKRKALEAVPSIGQVTIMRVLPDTLVVKITGKIPRAILYGRKSKWLINNSAIVMDRENCIRISRDLPIIYGFQTASALQAGMVLKETAQALELISLILRFYPEIKLLTINTRDPKFLDLKLVYRNSSGVYSVQMPKHELAFMLKMLKSALHQAQTIGEKRRIINMTYEGKIIYADRR